MGGRQSAATVLGKKSTAKEVIDTYGKGKYLSGKTAIVTGGNSGIGLETVKALAYAGCRVILCSRSIEAGLKAIQDEIEVPGEGNYVVRDVENIIVKQLDLSKFYSIKSFCDDITSRNEQIDFLILNAGIMALPQLEFTEAGFEKRIGVNHYGHFYLTSLLFDKIRKQPFPSRIIVLASEVHRLGNIDFNDIHFKNGRSYNPFFAYCQSKLANILFTKELADRLQDTNVTAVSLHPGTVRTNLWKPDGSIISFFVSMVLRILNDKTIPQGAATTIWACVSDRIDKDNLHGAYLSDCAPCVPTATAQDLDRSLRKKLWEFTENELKEALEKIK